MHSSVRCGSEEHLPVSLPFTCCSGFKTSHCVFPEEASNIFIRISCSALTVAQVLCSSRLTYLFLLSQVSKDRNQKFPCAVIFNFGAIFSRGLFVVRLLWTQGCGAKVAGPPQLLEAVEWFLVASGWWRGAIGFCERMSHHGKCLKAKSPDHLARSDEQQIFFQTSEIL